MTKEPTPDQTIEMLQRERDSLLDRVEGLRWMVDQMNKDSEAMVYDMETHGSVYAAVAYTFGPRCDDYDPGCPCCAAWEEYDRADRYGSALQAILDEWEPWFVANRGEEVPLVLAVTMAGFARVALDDGGSDAG